MRSSRDALAMALLALVALGLGVVALTCLAGCGARDESKPTATRAAPAAEIAVLTPIPVYPWSGDPPPVTVGPVPRAEIPYPYPGGTPTAYPGLLAPSPTPAPPSTATPQAPLDPTLETLFYFRPMDGETALMCLPVDAQGRPVGPPQDVTPERYRYPTTTIVGSGPGPIGRYTMEASIYALYPSPAGRYVAVSRPARVGAAADILDTRDWRVESLLPDERELENVEDVRFLAWSPDGSRVLLDVKRHTDEFEGVRELWLVDAVGRGHRVWHAFPPAAFTELRSMHAAFSHDGGFVAIALEVC